MRVRVAFLVGAAVVIAFTSGIARAQDLGAPFQRPPEAPKPAPKLTKAPTIKRAVEPVYPPGALDARASADVSMLVDIDADGKVTKVTVTKPVGQGFDEAAHDAVMQYLFTPAEVDGKPCRDPDRIHAALRAQAGAAGIAGRRRGRRGRRRRAASAAASAGRHRRGRPPAREGHARSAARRRGGGRLRTPEGVEKPAMVVGGTDADGRFEVKGQPGRRPARDRHRAASRALHPRPHARLETRADKPSELDCLVPKSGAPSYETTVRSTKPAVAVTRYELAQPELKVVPGTFGDPLRVVQNLPGVARSPFGLGALVIRGASPNDSGIYVEGHKIPHPLSLPRRARRAGARADRPHRLLPRQLRRHLRPRHRRRRRRRHPHGRRRRALHGTVDINLLHSAAYVEGPLGGGWSGSVSARRSYIDLDPAAGAARQRRRRRRPVYWDYQAGVNRAVAGREAVAVRVRQQRHAEGGLQRSAPGQPRSRPRDRIPQGLRRLDAGAAATGSTSCRPRTATSACASAPARSRSTSRRTCSRCATSCRASSVRA